MNYVRNTQMWEMRMNWGSTLVRTEEFPALWEMSFFEPPRTFQEQPRAPRGELNDKGQGMHCRQADFESAEQR